MKKVLTLSLLITAGVFSSLAAKDEAVYPTFQLTCYGRELGEGNVYRQMSDGSWQGKVAVEKGKPALEKWETAREIKETTEPLSLYFRDHYCGLCKTLLKDNRILAINRITVDKSGEAIEDQALIQELCE